MDATTANNISQPSALAGRGASTTHVDARYALMLRQNALASRDIS